jgi:hypothetical protein
MSFVLIGAAVGIIAARALNLWLTRTGAYAMDRIISVLYYGCITVLFGWAGLVCFSQIDESAGPKVQGPGATVISLYSDHPYPSGSTVSLGDEKFQIAARTDSGDNLCVCTAKGQWKHLRPGDRIKTIAKMGYYNRSEIVEYRAH